MTLTFKAYKYLARDYLRRIVFKNDPGVEFIWLPPTHPNRAVRWLQYVVQYVISPLLRLASLSVYDPPGRPPNFPHLWPLETPPPLR